MTHVLSVMAGFIAMIVPASFIPAVPALREMSDSLEMLSDGFR